MQRIIQKELLVFIGLALAIMGPLLLPGYILTLDMVVTPEWRMPQEVSNVYVFQYLLHVADILLPADVIQKLLLLCIFTLAGLGAYRLVRDASPPLSSGSGGVGLYAAGILYVINPFMYGRFMAGQYLVLFGAALLPWCVRAAVLYVRDPSWRKAVTVAAWMVAIGFVSLHAIAIAGLAIAVIVAGGLWRWRTNLPYVKSVCSQGGMVAGAFILINSFWLLPTLFGSNVAGRQIAAFGQGDLAAFATSGDNFVEQLVSVLLLQGFWPERSGLYVLPQHGIPQLLWWVVTAAVIGLVVTGAWTMARSHKSSIKSSTVLWATLIVSSALLATGSFNNVLSAVVPIFSGYREPYKFTMLVLLGYTVFVAAGVTQILRWLDNGGREILSGLAVPIALVLPALWAPSFLWGGRGQLQVTDYPRGWYAVNDTLRQDGDTYKVLSLPWHLYLYTQYAGRVIANPAAKFFDKPVLVSQNPELKGATGNELLPDNIQIDRLLTEAQSGKNIAENLAKMDVKYIIVTKDSDYQDYDHIQKQPGMQVTFEDETIALYKNLKYRP